MFARTASILVLGGTLVAGLAACGSTSTTTAQPPAGPAAAAATTASTPPRDQPAQPTAETKSAGCPVTVDTLLGVLKAKYGKLPAGQQLRGVQCYQDYAIVTRSAAQSDSEVETFHYVSGSWQYFVGGSAGYCEGVPAEVKKHFRGAGYPGCA